jgi:phosphate-selective porin OprO/OprP
LPSENFEGGYAQASHTLTGETHTYNPATAAYNGIVPAHPFSLESGGWGAWEIAGRFSTINLNNQLASANGVAEGRQDVFTAGLNWYVSGNIRCMFNYLHGDISKLSSPVNSTDTGSKLDALAMRSQVAF